MSTVRQRPWSPRLALLLVGIVATQSIVTSHAEPARQAAAAFVPAGHGASLTATSARLYGVVFDGVQVVPTASGEVEAIALSASSATLDDLGLRAACTPFRAGLPTGMAADISTASGSTSTAPAGMTLHATSVTATVGGQALEWSPTSPPPARQLGDLPPLTDVTVDLVSVELPALRAPGLRQFTSFCAL